MGDMNTTLYTECINPERQIRITMLQIDHMIVTKVVEIIENAGACFGKEQS